MTTPDTKAIHVDPQSVTSRAINRLIGTDVFDVIQRPTADRPPTSNTSYHFHLPRVRDFAILDVLCA